MPGLEQLLIDIHDRIGELPFLLFSALAFYILGLQFIPKATDLAVNTAAGLAGKYLGDNWRTLVINSTTNLPEAGLMLVSLLGLGRLGGIATPLGSNFANLYLMFLVAPIIVIGRWLMRGTGYKRKKLLHLMRQERKLVLWHLAMSGLMFFFASVTYWCLTGSFHFAVYPAGIRGWPWLLTGGVISVIGIFIFFKAETRLQSKRPELFQDIEDSDFEASVPKFILGASALILLCWMLNAFFASWTEIYSDMFAGYAIFAAVHYFVGSFISSLPETTVAVENYERLDAPDLNTAMAAASQSNMTNLFIAALGSFLAIIILPLGWLSGL